MSFSGKPQDRSSEDLQLADSRFITQMTFTTDHSATTKRPPLDVDSIDQLLVLYILNDRVIYFH